MAFPQVNRLTVVMRNSLRPVVRDLVQYGQPVMQLEVGPTVSNLLVRDLQTTNAYGIDTAIRIPLTKLVCARLETIYDTGRYIGEADRVVLNFEVPPYLHQPYNVQVRIQPEFPPEIPVYDGFVLRFVKPTPVPVTIGSADLWKFERALPNPPQGGLRAIAWALDVQSLTVPENIVSPATAGAGYVGIAR